MQLVPVAYIHFNGTTSASTGAKNCSMVKSGPGSYRLHIDSDPYGELNTGGYVVTVESETIGITIKTSLLSSIVIQIDSEDLLAAPTDFTAAYLVQKII